MQLLRKQDYPAYGRTHAFLGFQSEREGSVLELQYIWNNTNNYDIGNGFSHIAIAVADTIEFCNTLKKQGITITREPEATKGGSSIIAFIEDPDGYKIELLQRLK
jgi:lactoylglutathione lyase